MSCMVVASKESEESWLFNDARVQTHNSDSFSYLNKFCEEISADSKSLHFYANPSYQV